MSFSKGVKFDVKPFTFGQLSPDSGGGDSEGAKTPNVISTFELKSIKDASAFKQDVSQEVIRQERGLEKEKSFSILPLVRQHRGLKDQEEKDLEQAIEQEVQKRLQAAAEEARQEGYQAGHQEGYNKAYQEAMNKLDDKVEDFTDIVNNLKEQCHNVLSENKQDAYKMIKSLTQWITLKEVEDEDYLGRLLEKLIHEMNSKSNLVVRVGQNSFKRMPGIIETVEEKMGKLSNVRVEIDLDQEAPGIILESENGIIDGSLKAQMTSLEKLFESVGLNE